MLGGNLLIGVDKERCFYTIHSLVGYMIIQGLANMDGALTFTRVCVDSSRTVLEHPFRLIATKLY